MIEVSNLKKKFGDFSAVDGISFSVAEGEIMGLLGPNGAGKTTTIHMLLGLIKPTNGEIKILGMKMPEKREKILQKVSFSSAYTKMRGRHTVFENLYVFALLYGVKEPKERVRKLLADFDLENLAERFYVSLSSGEATRVNLCRALLCRPRILLLDEPTASLDPDVAYRIRKFLKKIKKKFKVTMLYTSHNMREVEEMCDRILLLNKGKIIGSGTALELTKKFAGIEAEKADLEKVFMSLISRARPTRGPGPPRGLARLRARPLGP